MADILSISRSALYALVERELISRGVLRFGPRFSRFDPDVVIQELRERAS
jgi:hypothetical protein